MPKPSVVQIPSLTAIRFFAAFAILIHHMGGYIFSFSTPTPFSRFFVMNGVLGMDLFFVLSGFIIHYNYHSRIGRFSIKGIFNFLVARFARLYPLFILFVIFDLATGNFFLNASQTVQNEMLQALPYFVSLTQSWTYQLIGGRTITYAYANSNLTWSISTELFLYLCYPFISAFLLRINKKTTVIVLFILMLAISHFPVFLGSLGNNLHAIDKFGETIFGPMAGVDNNISYRFSHWLLFLSPYVRFLPFLLGSVTAHLFMSFREKPVIPLESRVAFMVLTTAVIFIFLTYFERLNTHPVFRTTFDFLGYPPFLAVTILCCARYNNLVVRLLSWKPLVTFGEASYSIYLFHIVLITSFSVNNPVPLTGKFIFLLTARGIVLAGVIILISIGLYKVYEMPTRKFLRRLLVA